MAIVLAHHPTASQEAALKMSFLTLMKVLAFQYYIAHHCEGTVVISGEN